LAIGVNVPEVRVVEDILEALAPAAHLARDGHKYSSGVFPAATQTAIVSAHSCKLTTYQYKYLTVTRDAAAIVTS
jgi:hypothetical protein